MQPMKLLAIAIAAILIAACFFPWATIESKHVVLTGFDAGNFQKPGLFNVVFTLIIILFLLLNKIWSFRAAFFLAAFNIAWTVRNFISISACSGGICPEKQLALYVVQISSILLLVFILFGGKKERTGNGQ